MAKRRRLTPANPDFLGAAPETKSMAPLGGMRAPIADVASEASATAALEELSREMQSAQAAGRMIVSLPLSEIRLDHLVRDRIPQQGEDMDALVASLRARGQQTPIEVVALAQGGYGLISGWRRCTALSLLQDEGVGDGTVLAIKRRPDDASDAYLAMVEENEIRVGLSYFERARIAAKAVEQGVYNTEKEALMNLFGSASRAKRSKIRSFIGVVSALDGVLQFPQSIGERLGLQLSAALGRDPQLAAGLREGLQANTPEGAEEELKFISDMLARKTVSDKAAKPKKQDAPAAYATRDLRPGLSVKVHKSDGRLELSGPALTPDLRTRLLTWLEKQH